MRLTLGVLVTKSSGPLAAAAKFGRLGAKRAFILAGGRMQENALVIEIPTGAVRLAARLGGRAVLGHLHAVQAGRQAAYDAGRRDGAAATSPVVQGVKGPRDFEAAQQSAADRTTPRTEVSESAGGELVQLSQSIERLSGRVEVLRRREEDDETS